MPHKAGFYGLQGTGALYGVLQLVSSLTTDHHYTNEDGSRFRMFEDRMSHGKSVISDTWIINKNKMYDYTVLQVV